MKKAKKCNENEKISKKKSSEKVLKQDLNLIPFETWFAIKVSEGKLNYWQGPEIKTFFKEKDLKEIEDLKKYDEILKLY